MKIGHFSMDSEGVISPCAVTVASELMADEDARIVSHTQFEGGFVSTAFLPVCLLKEDGSPQAFETVIVRGHKSIVVKRYCDLADALRGHDTVVQAERIKAVGS